MNSPDHPGPLRLARTDEPGVMSTNSHVVLVQRGGASTLTDAAKLVAQRAEKLGLTICAGSLDPPTLLIDVTAALPCIDVSGVSAVLATTGERLRLEAPTVSLDARPCTWAAAERALGTDSLLWASLTATRHSAPIPLGAITDTLASRRDENPLARLLRAHSRAALALATESDPGTQEPAPSPDLRETLWLAPQSADDTVRTQRPRTWLRYLDDLAASTLTHLEGTPVTRTDLPALRLARKVMANSLSAVSIATPVPY